MKSYNSYTVADEHQGLTVEMFMKQILQYSGRKIQKLTRQKGILIKGNTVYLQRKLKAGDVLRILSIEDLSYGVLPEPGAIDILYEDASLVIVNKPAFLLVHPTGHTLRGTLANFLAYHFQQRGEMCTIRPLHRLDRDTSGCVVFAKDSRTQAILERQLQNGTLKRSYLAIVEGIVQPPSGTINAPIGPHPTMPNRREIQEQGDQAVTHYRTLQNFSDVSLLQLTLDTGRTHQIRLHLAHVGHPVVGDHMYGKRSSKIPRQALHAVSLCFIHPIEDREITVHAPIPLDFSSFRCDFVP